MKFACVLIFCVLAVTLTVSSSASLAKERPLVKGSLVQSAAGLRRSHLKKPLLAEAGHLNALQDTPAEHFGGDGDEGSIDIQPRTNFDSPSRTDQVGLVGK